MNVRTSGEIKQIYNEIAYVNEQFQNLRTYIVPDPKCKRIDLFYFVMFPADGSLADKPIVGKMFFPFPYPINPPILHLFTKTSRFNVDVYYQGEQSFLPISSMCFDILKKKTQDEHGIWEQSFNLTSVFASLLQVIVSVKVKQEYKDYEILELVSMEKMIEQHKHADLIWKKYEHYFPKCPKIKHVEAKKIFVSQNLAFANKNIQLSYEKSWKIYTSDLFLLYEADFSVLIDLTDLKKLLHDNHKYNFVISFIILNTNRDITGHQSNTILVRNGVTGTAAKKLENGQIQWFYHGKPLVDFEKIMITVSRRQVTMVIIEKDNFTNVKIHGDTVLTYLTDAEMGPNANEDLYTFNILVQTKNTIPVGKELERLYIRVKTDNNFGFVHPSDRYEHVVVKSEIKSERTSLLRLDLDIFLSKKIVINKNSYKYFINLIENFKIGEIDKPKSKNLIELNNFKVKCLECLLKDWRYSLPIEEQEPETWLTGFKSTLKNENENSASFWSKLKPIENQILIDYEPTKLNGHSVHYVAIELGSNSKLYLKKLLIKNHKWNLLVNFKKFVQNLEVVLAYNLEFESENKFNKYIEQFQENELATLKISGLIYDQFQLIFLVDSWKLLGNENGQNVIKRCLFAEFAYLSMKIKNLSDKLRVFYSSINDFKCNENETLHIFDEPFDFLGKIKIKFFQSDDIIISEENHNNEE